MDRRTLLSVGLALVVVVTVAVGLSLVVRLVFDPGNGRETTDGTMAADRPELRFTAERNWINDPNGPVVIDGRYHLFFQHNPNDTVWGDIGWGHAVSDDQLTWDELDMAITASEHTMAFSGSVVVDRRNSSGLCDAQPCLVALYTEHTSGPPPDVGRQEQSIAYSTDGGDTWEAYEGNPVLTLDEVSDFRDPSVFWHEPSESWIMSVALPLDRIARIYRSDDLLSWEHASDFGPFDAVDGIWECPVLLELPVADTGEVRWVLKIDHNPGHITGGSGAHYFVGDFDGIEFVPAGTPDQDPVRWVDFGPDFYCAMPFRGDPDAVGEPLSWVGWMSNWLYAEQTPTEGWRGAMTLPRQLGLREVDGEIRLTQVPVPQLAARRNEHSRVTAGSADDASRAVHGNDIAGEVLELRLRVEATDSTATTRLRLRGDDGSLIDIDYDAERSVVRLDRSATMSEPFHPDYPAAFEAPVPPGAPLDLHIVLDRSSIEVFTGTSVITALVFAPIGPKTVELETTAPTGQVTLDVWNLTAAGPDEDDD